jgi:sulfate-transporting ATPase
VGRRLIAVRTNERAAAALGVSVVGAKLYAFVVGAMIAAVGGVLLVFRLPSARFDGFGGLGSVLMMQNAVFGGVGSLAGPLTGSGFYPGTVGQQVFSFLGGKVAIYLALASSIGLMFMLTHAPDGLAEMTRKQNEAWLTKLRQRFSFHRPVDLIGAETEMSRVPPKELVLDGVTVRFGGTIALNEMSLTVSPGEVVGLIGPNGAGKSTAIDAITGFNVPARGRITLDGTEIGSWPRERRARFGVSRSFQSLELFDDLTVLENILAACDSRDLGGYVTTLFSPGRPRLSAAARAAVIDFGLKDVLQLRVNQLSYAQRRLLAVARAVAGGHSVLLLDEPASGLDEAQTKQLGGLIRRLARERGIGILLVEHSVDMVLRTCDRVYALDFGTIIGAGTPSEIRANAAVVEAYLGSSRHVEHELPETEGAL